MSVIFYLGFFMFITSTIGFIISILLPYWIVKDGPRYRGIFEVCDSTTANMNDIRACQYILTYNNQTSSYRPGLLKKNISLNSSKQTLLFL